MSSTEFNKIAGCVIGAFLILMLLNFGAGKIYGTGEGGHHEDDPLGFALAIATDDAEGPVEEAIDYAALVASADPAKGEKVFNKCKACHVIEQNVNRVGPNLYDVVGRQIASEGGFAYSSALAEKEGKWQLVSLSEFLEDPNGWAPGTKMNFGGLSKPEDRVNVIAYLNEAEGTPIELEVPEAEETAEVSAPATAPVEKVGDVPHSQDESGSIENAGKRSGDAAGLTTEILDKDGKATDEGAADEKTSEDKSSVTEEAPKAAVGEDDTGKTDEAAEDVKSDVKGDSAPAIVEEKVLTADDDSTAKTVTVTPAVDDDAADTAKSDDDAATVELKPMGTDEPAEEKLEVAASDAKKESGDAAADSATTDDTKTDAAATDGNTFVIAAAFQGGNADDGAKVFRKCRACHKVDEGKHGVGPSLFGIIGKDIAGVEGYNYSKALEAKEGDWTASELAAFLRDPKEYAPGTKMKFAGLKKDKDIVNLIHYLNETDGEPNSLQ